MNAQMMETSIIEGEKHIPIARFGSDELYRLVYNREDQYSSTPNWEELDIKYAGRIGYILRLPIIVPVQPYNSLMYTIEEVVEKIYVMKMDDPRLPDGTDPSLVTYNETPCECE
jgi:hypothetical protein